MTAPATEDQSNCQHGGEHLVQRRWAAKSGGHTSGPREEYEVTKVSEKEVRT